MDVECHRGVSAECGEVSTICDENGERAVWRNVGVDRADIPDGFIERCSPRQHRVGIEIDQRKPRPVGAGDGSTAMGHD